MADRHALLIGVPRYEDPEFNDAQLSAAVTTDIAAMRAALEQSGYGHIAYCGLGDGRGEATPTRIRRAVKAACAGVPAGGVLLIYFSGHGVTVGDHDYLVPSDAYRSDVQSDIDSLVPVIPDASALRDCRAALVVFFVDACRSDPSQALARGPSTSVEPGGHQLYLAGGGPFVTVMGCSANQACNYDEAGSVFTQALAKVFDARNPARTLGEVVDSVTADMARRSRQHPEQPQEPVVRNRAVLERAGKIVICDGDELAAAWRKAVNSARLLELCPDPEQVRDVVAECARRCGDAQDALHRITGLADPWTDQNYPGRVLANAEILLRNGGLLADDVTGSLSGLRPGEAALLVAAPFLREAVLAEGIRDVTGISPANFDRTYIPGDRGDLELTHEMHQHLVRRAIGLRDSGSAEASDQIVMWLVHRWLTGRVRLWEGAGAREIYQLGRPLIEYCMGSADVDEVPLLVQWMLLAVGADPADERLVTKLASDYVDNRWRFIAAVLWLAGIMAVDLRKLPPVVADLVGTRMELQLADVQDAASRVASWNWDMGTGILDLGLVCEHPAMHDAFDNVVKRAIIARDTIQASPLLQSAVSGRLPRSFAATRLRPKTMKSVDGEKEERAYEVPLSRFQIAEEKVRELLMGRQLYGNPALAIRELYQNALDACRWRETRHKYLTLTDKQSAKWARSGKQTTEWAGWIGIRRDIDEAGRPYIECEDNGVGMDLDTIKHVFSNAGERFVYRQDFRTEQADWANQGLRMVSNSQFGIGVFSYFMLADEISLTTRHQLRTGVAAEQAYEVRIASSGSLIQVNPVAKVLPDGGTMVRLYLNGDAADVSVLQTLRDLLWVTDYRVDVSDQNGDEAWHPGKLRYLGPAPEPLKYGDDLWWVSDIGGLAADGIRSGHAIFGVVANLRNEHRPHFTVDRNTLRSWDSRWVTRQIVASLPSLMTWPGFTLSWLWTMTQRDVEIAQLVFLHGAAVGQNIPLGAGSAPGSRASLGVVGCLPMDTRAARPGSSFEPGTWLSTWRAGVWRNAGLPVDVGAFAAERTDGFPIPDPIDAAILKVVAENGHNQRPGVALVASSLIAFQNPEIAARETVHAQLRRLRKYAIVGLDLSLARGVQPFDSIVDPDIHAFRLVLTDWSAPGEAPRRKLTVTMLRASIDSKEPIGPLLRRAALLAPPGWSPPTLDLRLFEDGDFTAAEKVILSRDADGVGPWLEGELLPAHLAYSCERLNRPITEILELCDRLTPLGYTVPGRESYPPELDFLELSALQRIDRPGQVLSLLQLVSVAGEAGISIGSARRGLARLEEHGMLVRPELPESIDFTLTRGEFSLLETLTNYGSFEGSSISPSMPALWVAQTLSLQPPIRPDQPSATTLAEKLIPLTVPDRPLTEAELVAAASGTGKTLGETATALRAVYPEVRLPHLSPACERLTVPWRIADALLRPRSADQISWGLGPGDIVRGALNFEWPLGDFLSELDPFRALGAPVPPYDDTLRSALNEVLVDDYELEILTVINKAGMSHSSTVSALSLLHIAGRLGWTVSRTHGRLAALVPIGLTLEYPAHADFPDDIVYWYDLLALTSYCDGHSPVISGRIDQAYLEKAAVEIFGCLPEETPTKADHLRRRLVGYASLFDFELDTPAEDADA